ncbi:hypothetical protein [Methylobacterium planeticum]|uniref:Uncharacterized protein n=1 Tax=Methylobacterium planeticum TaxID=2615211 RepID=A0A6N6MH38_9HYPH|nr:hypothetical protein [Methylobacterium planeticum]KAB1068747.1 hypothetical protein F6X51_26420 [Methylobacterium planeticum]
MAESPTIGELYKAKAITADDVVAAVEAYMADPTTTLFVMGEGYGLNLSEAVRSHPWSRTTVASAEASDHLKRAAVRTAILLARPEKR